MANNPPTQTLKNSPIPCFNGIELRLNFGLSLIGIALNKLLSYLIVSVAIFPLTASIVRKASEALAFSGVVLCNI